MVPYYGSLCFCRYYYPNVRDQLVAKGMLPLSKLCAMVTMQRQHPNEAQMFSLPLIPRTDSPTGHQPQPSGTQTHKQTPLNIYLDIRHHGAPSGSCWFGVHISFTLDGRTYECLVRRRVFNNLIMQNVRRSYHR